MSTIAKKLISILTPREKRKGFLLLILVLIMAAMDVMGVASILPFIAIASNPDVVETNSILSAVRSITGISERQEFIWLIGVVVLILLILSLLTKAVTTYALLRFALMAEYRLAHRLLEGYVRQPYVWFLNRHSADLGKTILSEVTNVVHGGLIPLLNVVAQGAVGLSLGLLLFFTDPVLCLSIFFTLASAYITIYLLLRGRLSRLGELRLQANNKRFLTISEVFSGIKEVKAAGLEPFYSDRFDKAAREYAEYNTTANLYSQVPRYMMEGVAFGGLMLLILFLIGREGQFTAALPFIALYAFAGYRLMPALQQVYAGLTQLKFAGPAIEALQSDLVALDPKRLRNDVSTVKSLAVKRSISVSKLQFTYPNSQQPALKGVSINVPARTTIGLVGATGSGKTTLVDIILGLLEPDSGTLVVDDQKIHADNVRGWQRSIGYVPQQIHLIDDSIAANIAFGVAPDSIDMDAVIRSARTAHLNEFVQGSLTDGYRTVIGEKGVRLSGGQRQRIGIARALYHDPALLILDEATSALDNVTEQAVMQAVNELKNNITIILIAHRLSTVRDCDQIVMLEKGCIVGTGTYSELLKLNEQFRTMAGV